MERKLMTEVELDALTDELVKKGDRVQAFALCGVIGILNGHICEQGEHAEFAQRLLLEIKNMLEEAEAEAEAKAND